MCVHQPGTRTFRENFPAGSRSYETATFDVATFRRTSKIYQN